MASNAKMADVKNRNELKYLLILLVANIMGLSFIYYVFQHYNDEMQDLTYLQLLIAVYAIINLILLLPFSLLIMKKHEIGNKKPTGVKKWGNSTKLSSVWTFIYAVVIYISSVAFFHMVSVVFGAPVIDVFDRTCHFALLLSTVTVLPVLIIVGTDMEEWTRIFIYSQFHYNLELLIYATTLASIFGAWIGAFPIPLDWDRPWQIWPISCTFGTVLGHTGGVSVVAVYTISQHWKHSKKST